MAPSQQEYYQEEEQDMNTLQYTHKKFNCGYSHKKLGLRLIRRNSQEELQREQTEQQQAINSQDKQIHQRTSSSTNTLFRPYALDDESPKKRKTSLDNKPQFPETPTHHHHNSQIYTSPIPHYLYQIRTQQSQEEYARKLQRQRAALYMKHVMQFYENGNGWPSVHPNAINNPALYQQ